MCGIAGELGPAVDDRRARRMAESLRHRGPDASGVFVAPSRACALSHRRLSIIDTGSRSNQPMTDPTERWTLVFNGEIYNYRELRSELEADWSFRTASDTEVLLAAWSRWRAAALPRLLGMFAFALWDERQRRLVLARDRFGVKPLYTAQLGESLLFASEIKGLHAAGVPREPDAGAWGAYLVSGLQGIGGATFWRGIDELPAGALLEASPGGERRLEHWYDLAARVADEDRRTDEEVRRELEALLEDAVRLRFRSDVPVGINLSGGLDSSTLFTVTARLGADGLEREPERVRAFTFVTGDASYDELPWVRRMTEPSVHPLECVRLDAEEVPARAERMAAIQDEPSGGLPTLAYGKLFERAAELGVKVLLDGQGLDESWAGYDYYRRALAADGAPGALTGALQGSREPPTRPRCVAPELAAAAEERLSAAGLDSAVEHQDPVRRLQIADVLHRKLPRALRYNDRLSMASSRELREPFLDHRLVELGLRQPAERKVSAKETKILLRRTVAGLVPSSLRLAPKRPVQTPQREWLRGPLAAWVEERLEALRHGPLASWTEPDAVADEWRRFRRGGSDNSFFVWQWIELAMLTERL